MHRSKISLLTTSAWLLLSNIGFAQSTNPPAKTNAAAGTNAVARPDKPAAKSQSEAASKTAAFAKTAKTDDAIKTALDAHDLAGGMKLAEKTGAFKGTVTGVFEPKGNAMAILNFDKEYRTAMTAVVRKENFEKFPDLKSLVGKEVLVTGKFIDYQGRAELILTEPAQIKRVE